MYVVTSLCPVSFCLSVADMLTVPDIVCCLVDGPFPSAQRLLDRLNQSSVTQLSQLSFPHVESSLPDFSSTHSDKPSSASPWSDVAEMSAVPLLPNMSDSDGGKTFVSL